MPSVKPLANFSFINYKMFEDCLSKIPRAGVVAPLMEPLNDTWAKKKTIYGALLHICFAKMLNHCYIALIFFAKGMSHYSGP